MLNHFSAGYREHNHTADLELEAWAPDLPGLFEQAARGMYSLSGVRLQAGGRTKRAFKIATIEPEQLLVMFLNELLYLEEMEGLGFDAFSIHIDENGLQAEISGAPVATIGKEIKAVTYHHLKIISTLRGMETRLVFDV